ALTPVAATPLNVTVVPPATKFRPSIVTLCPTAALVGVKPEISGGALPGAGAVPGAGGVPGAAPPSPPPPPQAPRPAARQSTARPSQRGALRVNERRLFTSRRKKDDSASAGLCDCRCAPFMNLCPDEPQPGPNYLDLGAT